MKTPAFPFRSALLASAAASLLFAGCSSLKLRRESGPPLAAAPVTFVPETVADAATLDPTLLMRPTDEYRLGPGDQLEIDIIGELGTRTRTVVGPDGKVYFNLLPGVDVWGLTLNQARTSLVREMQRYVRETPAITVSLVAASSQKIWVLGRLNKPGVYSMSGPMTLLEAIAAAGGPAPTTTLATRGSASMAMAMASANGASDEAADLRRAFVIRNGKHLPVNFEKLLRDGDLSQNIYLRPDDFVYMPSEARGTVHVLGAVQNPRAVEYTARMTLAQAIAQAGGTTIREAQVSQVAIVRGSISEPRVAYVDLRSILHGSASDILLEPQDIVYVPHNPYRVGVRLIDTILDTFVRVVGVNEGARAVGQGTSVGVNVPLGGP
jgi:protein involved in polysaccharide export with SLBB domain